MDAYTDADFIHRDPFDGADRDVKIRARKVSIVTTRSPHECYSAGGDGKPHDIPAGTRARYERALVDGEWGQWWCCLDCMTRWLKELGVKPTATTTTRKE